MKIKTVTYGRTIILDSYRRQEKVWFGWTAEVEEGEDPETVLPRLREKADALERDIRTGGPWRDLSSKDPSR